MEKIKIFISWSGERSLAVAKALKEYLPMIVNAFDPWLSSTVTKGSRSIVEISEALETARAGIICLTPSNLDEPWILFEAGAIQKRVMKQQLACTLLIGLKNSDIKPPLAQFQHTALAKDDMLQMVKDLNGAFGNTGVETSQIEKAFETFWPKLKERFDNLPSDGTPSGGTAKRSADELLTEILDTVRGTQSGLAKLAQLPDAVSDLANALSPRANPWDSLLLGRSPFYNLGSLRDASSSASAVPESPFQTYAEVLDAMSKPQETTKPGVTPSGLPPPPLPSNPLRRAPVDRADPKKK